MHFIYILTIISLLFTAYHLQAQSVSDESSVKVATIKSASETFDFSKIKKSPRLILTREDEANLKNYVNNSPEIKKVHNAIISSADELISLAPVTRTLEGRRMLTVSQDALKRIFFLSYAYRMTNDKKYAQRAEKEMLAITKFTDWNPSHFLDTAEMCAALAIGIDWLDDFLSDESKAIIKKSILEKALLPSLENKNKGIFFASNNWNSVCNAGIVCGAIAIYEDNPNLAQSIIKRAIKGAPKTMIPSYAPDGAYPEGFMYWGYGTSFQVLLITALESAFGSDAGMSQSSGFLESARYICHMTRPTGKCFNYADASSATSTSGIKFWFAKKLSDTSILINDIKYYKDSPEFSPPEVVLWQNRNDGTANYKKFSRLLPLTVVFANGIDFEKISAPNKKFWSGKGENPVALARSSWNNNNAVFLGIKGGKGNISHAHLDAGSFVFDANGVSWAEDLGAENYHKMESNNLNLWQYTNGCDRWSIFRYNNKAHNTITIDDQEHLFNGFVPIIETYDSKKIRGAKVDMKNLFGKKVKSATRKAILKDESFVEITDEIESNDKEIVIRWNLCTTADVAFIPESSTIELTKDGKSLAIVIDSEEEIEFKIWSATPNRNFESQNKDYKFVGFTSAIKENKKVQFKASLIPLK